MSEIKHTPTPWKVVSTPHFDSGLVYTSVQPVNVDDEAMKALAMMNGEYHVCRMSHTAAEWRFSYHRANAAFIVTAVNAYDKQRALIEKLTAALVDCEDYFDNRADADSDQDGFIPNDEMRMLQPVRRALAAAKQEGF